MQGKYVSTDLFYDISSDSQHYNFIYLPVNCLLQGILFVCITYYYNFFVLSFCFEVVL